MKTSTQRTFGSPRSAMLVIIAILMTPWTAGFANGANAEPNWANVEVKAAASTAAAAKKPSRSQQTGRLFSRQPN